MQSLEIFESESVSNWSNLENDIENVCFICNFSKERFHSSAESYAVHTKKTHYMWNYIYFLVGLLERDEKLKSGTETQIEFKYRERDLSWFPVNRTRYVEETEDDDHWLKDKVFKIEQKLDFLLSIAPGNIPKALPDFVKKSG